MNVKFEESNSLMKNVVEIDSLGEDFEKIFMKDSLAQHEEEKSKDDSNGEVQDVEVEPTQPLPRISDMLQAIPRTSLLMMYPKG